MTIASRIPAVLNELESVATTAMANTGCQVFRGPFVTGDPGSALFIGYDGDPGGDFETVIQNSEWAGLGAKARNEMFDVFCAITELSGENNVGAATDHVFVLFSAFEDAMRANPGLNQAPRLTAAVATVHLSTMPHPSGLQVRLTFTVRVSARI
jgi:hypothetical protein